MEGLESLHWSTVQGNFKAPTDPTRGAVTSCQKLGRDSRRSSFCEIGHSRQDAVTALFCSLHLPTEPRFDQRILVARTFEPGFEHRLGKTLVWFQWKVTVIGGGDELTVFVDAWMRPFGDRCLFVQCFGYLDSARKFRWYTFKFTSVEKMASSSMGRLVPCRRRSSARPSLRNSSIDRALVKSIFGHLKQILVKLRS